MTSYDVTIAHGHIVMAMLKRFIVQPYMLEAATVAWIVLPAAEISSGLLS